MPDYTPDFRFVVASVTTPAGTTQAAPLKTAFDPGRVSLIEAQIIIPDGHAGQTGVALVYDAQGVIPWAFPPAFLVGNGEQPVFPLDMLVGHAMQIWTYNVGVFEHTHYLRVKVKDTTSAPAQPLPVLVSIAAPTSGDAAPAVNGSVTVDESQLVDTSANG